MSRQEEILSLLGDRRASGPAFFRNVAHAMCLQTQSRWAAIAKRGADGQCVSLLAFWDTDHATEPFEFTLAGTPCEQIYAGTRHDNHFFVPDHVQDKFPAFPLLRQIGAESYRGHVFYDGDGDAAGHILVMDDKPADASATAETFFQLVSQRVGAEYSRWQAEQSLWENQRRLQEFAEASTDSLWETDERHRLTYFTQRFFPVDGPPEEELLGTTRWELAGGDPDTDPFWAEHKKLLDAHQPFRNFEYSVPSPGGGKALRLSVSGKPVFDDGGRFRGYRGASNNITEKYEIIEELRRSKERYHHLFDFANDSIFIVDPGTRRILEVNRVAMERLGYSRGELTNMTVDDLYTGSDFSESLKRFAAAKEGSACIFETSHRRKDGKRIPMEISARIVELDGRKVSLAFGRDISERKASEDELRQAQKLEAIGRLTGGIAHDFNNLLAVIIGNLELAEGRAGDDTHLRDMIGTAIDTAEKGAELISRLLSFSRKQALNPKTLNAGAVVASLHDLLRRTLPENIDIMVRAADRGSVSVDPRQLENALLNLVVNCQDAMPDGGVLSIETGDVMLDAADIISHQDVEPGDYVVLSVSDDGEGIDAKTLDRVFEPFFTTKEVGKGSGMGLSMVMGFVRQSRGHVTISSEPEIGTTVKLYFPRVDTPRRPEAGEAGKGPTYGQGERILVVEDNASVQALTVSVLTQLGYTVQSASTGPKAIAAMESLDGLDLLMTDVVLAGGMDGPTVAAKARKRFPDLRVLFMSGYADTAVESDAGLDRDATLLPKPFRRADLAASIRAILDEPGSAHL